MGPDHQWPEPCHTFEGLKPGGPGVAGPRSTGPTLHGCVGVLAFVMVFPYHRAKEMRWLTCFWGGSMKAGRPPCNWCAASCLIHDLLIC